MGVTVNHWLAEFESQMRSQVNGGVAHLGEQDLCKVKVAGSSPVTSTIIRQV